MKIFKFPLCADAGPETIQMPRGAKVISVGAQGLFPVLWAECGEHAEIKERNFYLAATGEELPADFPEAFRFIGTVQLEQPRALVFHVYEVP